MPSNLNFLQWFDHNGKAEKPTALCHGEVSCSTSARACGFWFVTCSISWRLLKLHTDQHTCTDNVLTSYQKLQVNTCMYRARSCQAGALAGGSTKYLTKENSNPYKQHTVKKTFIDTAGSYFHLSRCYDVKWTTALAGPASLLFFSIDKIPKTTSRKIHSFLNSCT